MSHSDQTDILSIGVGHRGDALMPSEQSSSPRQFVSLECAKYLRKASTALDYAVQLCGDLELAGEIDGLERRCDELATLATPGPVWESRSL